MSARNGIRYEHSDWSRRRDLNPRPSRPERDALPTALRLVILIIITNGGGNVNPFYAGFRENYFETYQSEKTMKKNIEKLSKKHKRIYTNPLDES